MAATRIGDLLGVEVEHLVSATTGEPRVTVRAIGNDTRLLGQMSPDEARRIAAHLVESAARAEYEVDLLAGLAQVGLAGNEILAVVLHAVRSGERTRQEGGGDAG